MQGCRRNTGLVRGEMLVLSEVGGAKGDPRFFSFFTREFLSAYLGARHCRYWATATRKAVIPSNPETHDQAASLVEPAAL